MARYVVLYSETYSAEYLVEAETFQKAKDKLYDAIQNGLQGPEICGECSFKDNTDRYSKEELESESIDVE